MIVFVMGLAMPALAEFRVSQVEARAQAEVLAVSGRIDLALSPRVEEALAKGIAMDILIDLRLYRERAWLWNELVATWLLRRQVRFQALTGQYLVTESVQCSPAHASCVMPTDNASELVGSGLESLAETLRQVGSLNDLRLRLPQALEPELTYALDVRGSLDIEALPAPLRPVAYTSTDWHLNSGWTAWTLKR